MRNRRYTLRKGPLVVYANNNGIAKAFRNLPGVEVASVDSLNLLQVRQLASAAHVHQAEHCRVFDKQQAQGAQQIRAKHTILLVAARDKHGIRG